MELNPDGSPESLDEAERVYQARLARMSNYDGVLFTIGGNHGPRLIRRRPGLPDEILLQADTSEEFQELLDDRARNLAKSRST